MQRLCSHGTTAGFISGIGCDQLGSRFGTLSAAPRSYSHLHGGSRGREAVRERKQRKRMLGFDFTRDALRALVAYGWSGNVRELARSCSLFVIHARPGAWTDPTLLDACLPDLRARAPTLRPSRSSGRGPR